MAGLSHPITNRGESRGTRKESRVRKPNPLPIAARRHRLVTTLHKQLNSLGVVSDSPHTTAKSTPIVVGVSGGADSVSLLIALAALSQRQSLAAAGLKPIVVHVHHHLRPSADGDADHVAHLCRRFGIPLRVEHVDPSTCQGNLSAAARELRYDALEHAACDVGARFVAVAHHAEDQLVTLLMALCRGTGLDGLAGMPRARPLSDKVTLIRPWLEIGFRDCEELCLAADIEWCRDPSNDDLSRARNRVRHEILPVLEDLWPSAARHAASSGQVVSAAAAALDHMVAQSFGPAINKQWERSSLAHVPVPIIAAGLRRAALNCAPHIADELSHRHLAAAAEAIAAVTCHPQSFTWPGGLTLTVRSKLVRLETQVRNSGP